MCPHVLFQKWRSPFTRLIAHDAHGRGSTNHPIVLRLRTELHSLGSRGTNYIAARVGSWGRERRMPFESYGME